MKLGKKLVLASAITAMSAGAQAAPELLLQYGTQGGTASLAPYYANAAVSADNLVAGPGLDVQNYSTFNMAGWDTESTDFDAAVAAGDFWTFGFDATQSIQLTSFDIRLDRSGTGPDDVEIRASVNGGTGTTVFGYDYQDSTSGVNFLGLDLSGIALNAGDSLVFTLAAFNSESTGGTFDLETITYPGGNDGISIYGEVAPVPLPAAAWLFLGGLASVFGLSRQKKA